MSDTVKVTALSWDEEVLKAKGLILVDFWAPWCGPCQMVAPIVEDMAKEYKSSLKVCKLNTDENPEIAGRYQIMGIPTLVFFRDGQALDKIVGFAPKNQFKTKIDALLKQ